MPTEIYLVKVGMTMTEGMVSEWYVADGATVVKGDPLYALETEKINMDVEAETSGIVRHLATPGTMMDPGAVVGYIFAEGEKIPDDIGGLPAEPVSPDAVALEEPAQAAQEVPEQALSGDRVFASPAARRLAGETGVDYRNLKGSGPGGRVVEADVLAASRVQTTPQDVKASPAARRAAREMNIELDRVQGSGPGGRVIKEDVEAFAAAPAATAGGDRIALSGMRRTIARRMHESLRNTAQLSMDMEVIMDEAVKMRTQLISEWQSENVRPTYTDIVIRAVTRALAQHPQMNSEFRETEILFHPKINIGLAVSLDDGLVVPVIRDADHLSLKEICVESARLAAAAREGTLGLDDFAGGTFTVTALGMYGVDSFTPILNEPQAGILGVNRIFDGLAWQEDRPVQSKRMNLSLTWDHRVLDGVPAARFLGTVRELLEAPYRLLV